MNEVWLAFHPEKTDSPGLFAGSVIPIYGNSTLDGVYELLDAARDYTNIAAIDAVDQLSRRRLVKMADLVGFNLIELDEQITKEVLSLEQYNELRDLSNIPIGLTSTPDALISWTREKNRVKPDFICPEFYSATWLNRIDLLKQVGCKVIPVINYTQCMVDPTLEDTIPTLLQKFHALWLWGANTGNLAYEEIAMANWPTVKNLLITVMEN